LSIYDDEFEYVTRLADEARQTPNEAPNRSRVIQRLIQAAMRASAPSARDQ
jgi:hypothetical protein